MAESILVIITLIAMVGSLALIFVPAMPVSVIEWSIAILFGVFTTFSRLPLSVAAVITVIMLISITQTIWLPIFGYRGEGTSCMGMIALLVGMIAGGIMIPIPIVGSLIGGALAVMTVEYTQHGNWRKATKSGQKAMKTVLLGMILEFVFAVTIVTVTFLGIYATA
jgi:uncharacterized protein YqgC (DUF456 family)